MATPVITISSDVSEESVGSIVSRVILFGTIPIEILIVQDIPIDLPSAPELPAVSPFLCLDDSESEPADELPERYVLLILYDDVVSRWRSSSPDTTKCVGGKEEDVGFDELGEGGLGVVSKIGEIGGDVGRELFGDRGGDMSSDGEGDVHTYRRVYGKA
ncbi:hypothetical protein Tco_1409166 [Tanacetum coccineum]